MAINNCEACSDLREDAPGLFVNGLTSSMVTSLKNNTGLVPSSGNDDCEDLNNMADCLVGNMATEVDAYEVCDWKDFMKNFIPNAWTTIKGIIPAVCGLWTKVEDLEERQAGMCELLEQTVSPQLLPYGPLPLAATASAIGRRCGTVTNKVVRMPDDGTLNPYTKAGQNIGIAYAKMTIKNCEGKREMFEWIAPNHYYYKLAQGATSGDVLWKITKSEAQSVLGMSDYLWETFERSSWTWYESALLISRQIAWMHLGVGDYGLNSNEMGLTFLGCSAPNNAISTDMQIQAFNNASARLYRHVL